MLLLRATFVSRFRSVQSQLLQRLAHLLGFELFSLGLFAWRLVLFFQVSLDKIAEE